MGNPVVVFTTYDGDSDFATTNVSGHAANSTQSPFIELTSDAVPQSATFSNGDYSVTDFDTIRTITTVATEYANGDLTGGTHGDTVYTTRGTSGTFALSGGQFELCEFDTGVKSSSIADHVSKSGVSHDYLAFANTGDGNGLTHTVLGAVIGASTAAVGPPTAYAPNAPFANIEYDVAHTSTPLQAIAGGGTSAAAGHAGIYVGSMIQGGDGSGGDPYTYTWTIANPGARTQAGIVRQITGTVTETDGDGNSTVVDRTFTNTTAAIMENWFPRASYSPSTTSAAVHQGNIKFRVHPDSEYEMSETMTTTNVAVASVTIAASGDVGPIATHSKVTVTTDSVHGLTDEQNQIVLTGATDPTHINGIHNVHSVTSTTVFTYEIVKSTVSAGQTVQGTFKLQTYDGIDKTGAVIKTSASGAGAGIGEIVHGGCGGNNTVLLRGDASSNISLGTQYYVYTDNSASASIASVKFTSGPTYKSMFKEMGLILDENTGQVSTNGAFAGKIAGDKSNVSGLAELDSYFPKFKHARNYALNRVKNDGTIIQSGDVVTIQGSTNLPSVARYKTLEYQNGFTTNVSYATSNTDFTVQSNTEISSGESYRLTYADTSWPTTNASSYWFLNNVNNSPVVDDDSNILIFKTTSENTNFKVHFTLRAQKYHGHMDVYTGSQGTTNAASVLNTIDGWGDGLETGTGNYHDGYFYASVYNNTDSDRDDQLIIFSDQNNASSTTLDFNGNAFKHRDDPDDPATEVAILNEEALANAYSNGDFTLLTSI